MGSLWTFVGLTLALFLLVQIVTRIALSFGRSRNWEVVAAWNLDDSHSGTTNVRVRFPAPGYRVRQRGTRFRGERVDQWGEPIDTFRARHRMNFALQDCWGDYEDRSDFSIRAYGKKKLGSEMPGGAGTLHTA